MTSAVRTGPALAAGIAAFVLLNLATALWLPGWTYVPVNIAAAAMLVAGARITGSTAESLGLSGASLGRGIRLGLITGAAALAVVAIGALVPLTRTMFEDSRAADIGGAGLAYQMLVRIPIGTALFEELAFRGVLLDQGRRLLGRTGGTALAAILFGLWHILPARSVTTGNEAAGSIPDALVLAGAVAATALAGWAFTILRDRSGSLAEPVIVHAALNTSAFMAAWLVVG
ncbi:CPBP family intramembrane metalloprotease [bacterium]|nr:CPBP family intramembrane metalloprotease [bacterium]